MKYQRFASSGCEDIRSEENPDHLWSKGLSKKELKPFLREIIGCILCSILGLHGITGNPGEEKRICKIKFYILEKTDVFVWVYFGV